MLQLFQNLECSVPNFVDLARAICFYLTQMVHNSNAIRALLLDEWSRLKSESQLSSLRSFSEYISIAPSALSEIMSGKRPISLKVANRILDALCVGPEQRKKFFFQEEASASTPYSDLSLENFSLISEWHYFAILSLIETKNFRNSIVYISKKLAIPKFKVKEAIVKLERLDLIKKSKSGKWARTKTKLATPSDIASIALRKSHIESSRMAVEALQKVSVDQRDFSSVTMPIDPSKMEEAKKIIKDFRRKLSRVMDNGNTTEVYRLNCQFFPLSNLEVL